MYVDDHPPAVNVMDLQMSRLGATCSGGIKGHQHGAMKCAVGRVDESSHLLRAENLRQPDHLPRIRRLSNAPVPLQHLDVEEPQGAQALMTVLGLNFSLENSIA